MKRFQIFRYLKKFLLLIVVFFIAMTALAYQVIESKQQYTASAVIRYSNEGAVNGLAPDGSAIDISEINSSANMAKVISNLGLSSYSLDSLCASIKVVPVIEEQPGETPKPSGAESEEAKEKPTTYIISCTLGNTGSRELVRNILNELLDVYLSDFSNKHINLEQVNNQTKDMLTTDYDYLEIVENIDAQLEETTKVLEARYQRAPNFRSSETGYSFADLRDQFGFLEKVNVSKLYALILGQQITKDKDLLINKYENRIANYGLTGDKAQEDIANVLQVIKAYVDKMIESGNADIDYNYILKDLHEGRWESGNLVDRTVEYDTLLKSWITYKNSQDYAIVDTAYCKYVIGVYRDGNMQLSTDSQASPQESEKTEEGDKTEEGGDKAKNTGSQDETPVSYVPAGQKPVTHQEVEAEIQSTVDKMNELYGIVERTNVEYNEYMGATNIRILSSASAGEALNMQMYTVMIAVFFLLIGCGGAILLGRAGDILEYQFLKDHLTGCMNRLACDKYIQKWEEEILSPDMCCINIQITNQKDMNRLNGREQVDQGMKDFGRVLRQIFDSQKESFVGYNGSGQFWVFFEKESQGALDREVERLTTVLAQTLSQIAFTYQLGAVNAGDASMVSIRQLISKSVKEWELYATGESQKETSQEERQ